MPQIRESRSRQRKLGAESWRLVHDIIVAKLTDDDDPALWQFALTTILGRTRIDAECYNGKEAIFVEIGCCSHWIRPKWKTDSGMTFPFGYAYATPALSWRGLPQFDWSLKWRLNADSGVLEPARGGSTRRPLRHRICLPARTARHPQATAHTVWTPGWPSDPARKWTMLYGFSRTKTGWRCFTRWEGDNRRRRS
jgi:hypothetical protein